MYKIASLAEKKIWKHCAIKAQQILKTLVRNAASTMVQNKKLKRNATSAIALLIELCLPLIRVVSSAGLFGSGSNRFRAGSSRIRAGLGPKVDKISGLIRAWAVLFVLGAQKYNQNNLVITLTFFRRNLTFVFFFRGWFGLEISFWVRAGFGPELVGSFATPPLILCFWLPTIRTKKEVFFSGSLFSEFLIEIIEI